MLLKPFNYFGSKHLIAQYYPKPKCSRIIEPFAGSAGYACRYHELRVELYDLNPKIFGIWDYLIKSKGSEIRKLPIIFDDVSELKIPKEAKWLIGFWIQAGSAHPATKPSSWAKSKQRPNSYWGAVIREQVANIADSIKHWKVFNTTYDLAPNCVATWFIDPPYQRAGKGYPYNIIDYRSLALWCKDRYGQTIVCEEKGAEWLPFEELGNFKGNPNSKSTMEMIYEQWI